MYKLVLPLSRIALSSLFKPSIIPLASQRSFTLTNSFWKKFETLDPDTDVILLGNKDKRIKMKYSQILEKVGSRKLVKIQKTKKVDSDLPMFKIMSDVDLEIAARKSRAETKYNGSKTIYETDSGRLKQKQIELKTKLSDHDLNVQTSKMVKWLEKGNFVKVDIKIAKEGVKSDAEALKKKIEDQMLGHKDLLGLNNSKLIINVK